MLTCSHHWKIYTTQNCTFRLTGVCKCGFPFLFPAHLSAHLTQRLQNIAPAFILFLQRAKSAEQRAESVKQRIESAKQRAESAKQRAEAAESELARLRALLQQQGIDFAE